MYKGAFYIVLRKSYMEKIQIKLHNVKKNSNDVFTYCIFPLARRIIKDAYS